MDFPKYDGNISPDEWINNLITKFNKDNIDVTFSFNIAKSLVDSTVIKLSAEIDNFEKLCNALKDDTSFTVFKIQIRGCYNY